MDIKDVLRKGNIKKVIKSVRVSKADDEFIKEHKISLNKVVDVSLKELKDKIKKDTGAWK